MRFIFVFLGLLSCSVWAQKKESSTEKDEASMIIDSLFEEDEQLDTDEEDKDLLESVFADDKELKELFTGLSDFKFLYFSLDYNSDTYFSGRDVGIDQYNVRPQITYLNSKGFFASISGIYYSEFDPKFDFLSATIGYGKSIGKKKRIRFTSSYSRFVFLNDLENPFTNNLNLGVGIRTKNRNLGTRLSTSFSFGAQESSFQISSTIFARFKLFKKTKTSLFFTPSVNFQVGDQLIFGEPVFVVVDDEEEIFQEEDEVFDLMNIQYNFPITYSTEKFDIEFAYIFNNPQSHGFNEYNNTHLFNISIAYLLEL